MKLSTCDVPRRNRDILWVERLKGSQQETFVISGKSVYGFFTHWTGSKTVPCWENHDNCEGGHTEATLRENYFLQCFSLKRGKQVFVYFTPDARDEFFEQVPEGQSFVGLTLVVRRSAKNNGRLHVEVQRYIDKKETKARQIDPYLSVLNFLKVPRNLIDQARSLGTIPDIEKLAS